MGFQSMEPTRPSPRAAPRRGHRGGGRRALSPSQREDGHFVYQLEADATIPPEYVLLGIISANRSISSSSEVAVYLLRRIQGAHGGWPLFQEGALDMSASVKAYFALKMIGDSTDAPHMGRAREAILAAAARRTATCSPASCSRCIGVTPWRACR